MRLHVRLADAAVRLGPAPAAESYLRADAIIEAALATGAEAIHPGYGFLSERAAFARAVDRRRARRSSARAPTRSTPSATSSPPDGSRAGGRRAGRARDARARARRSRRTRVAAIVAEAERIGFPLLVKAAAGGGGRGMRRVDVGTELPAALAAGSAEALAAFGDGAVYLEREIRPARHIEVQLLGDADGTIVALGERDCSIQRRHQKLVEESPAPGLTPDERPSAPRRSPSAVGARRPACATRRPRSSCSTRTGRFWFLEVNARLQVEHGVTELVSGPRPRRASSSGIAAGRAAVRGASCAAAARPRDPTRHAIEVRLAAEDPARDFAPTPGRVGAG